MRKILYIFVLCVVSSTYAFSQTVTRKVVDSETGLSLPFTTVQSSDNSIALVTNEEGVFSLEIKDNLVFTFSHVGYKRQQISSQQLRSENVIRMEIMPFELSTVVIRVDEALRDIYRAIDSTYKRIPRRPFFQRCFKQEIVRKNGKIVENSRAIIDIKIYRIFKPGRGEFFGLSLKGLDIHIDGDTILDRPSNLIPVSFINQFVSGRQSKSEENLIFTRGYTMDGDSNILISYSPRPDYSGDKIYTSGGFTIDRKTWTILKINQFYDSHALIKHNNCSEKKLLHEYNRSFYFTKEGIVSKIESKTVYSEKSNPSKIFTMTNTHIYRKSSESEYIQRPSVRYTQRKNILEQRAITMPDFDRIFQQGFNNEK
jgi:hypothetical protein